MGTMVLAKKNYCYRTDISTCSEHQHECYIALMHIYCCCLENKICCGAVWKDRKRSKKQDRMDLNELPPEFDYDFLDDQNANPSYCAQVVVGEQG